MGLKSEKIKLGEGINLNLITTDKFKSNILSYYFIRPLSKEETTKNALIPLVLKRGTKEFPDNLAVQRQLEEMYGANFSMAINKRGERQVIRFTMEWPNGNYIGDKELKFKVFQLLKGLIFEPVLQEGHFKKEYVDQEKKNLKSRIEGRINDKRQYAIERCIEEMCKNEKFSISSLGYIKELEKINEKNLFEHYENIIATSPVEIFYVGEIDQDLIDDLKNHDIPRGKITYVPRESIIGGIQTKNMVHENLDVTQGKIVLGYRTGIPYEDKLYNGLLVASDILGGGPNSKLFKNVREKESLAYYITSSIYKYKSIMLIDGGVEFDKFNRTIEIVRQQIDDMKKGSFTQEDIDISKRSLQTSTESIKDSIFLISEFFFSQVVSGDKRSLGDIIDDINSVTKDEIIEASNKINLDTIYLMENK